MHQTSSLWCSFCSVEWICFLPATAAFPAQLLPAILTYNYFWNMEKQQLKEHHLPFLYLLHIFRRHKLWSPADSPFSFKRDVCLDHFLRRKEKEKVTISLLGVSLMKSGIFIVNSICWGIVAQSLCKLLVLPITLLFNLLAPLSHSYFLNIASTAQQDAWFFIFTICRVNSHKFYHDFLWRLHIFISAPMWIWIVSRSKGEGYFCKEFSLGHCYLTFPSNE